MEFDFIDNAMFRDRPTAFMAQEAQTLPGDSFFDRKELDTGARVQPNGDVKFGYYAPRAQDAFLCPGVLWSESFLVPSGRGGHPEHLTPIC